MKNIGIYISTAVFIIAVLALAFVISGQYDKINDLKVQISSKDVAFSDLKTNYTLVTNVYNNVLTELGSIPCHKTPCESTGTYNAETLKITTTSKVKDGQKVILITEHFNEESYIGIDAIKDIIRPMMNEMYINTDFGLKTAYVRVEVFDMNGKSLFVLEQGTNPNW